MLIASRQVELAGTVARAAGDLADLLCGVSGERPCLGHWDVAAVTAHVVDGLGLHRDLLLGRPSPIALGEGSLHAEEAVRQAGGRALEDLADELRPLAAELAVAARERPATDLVPWHGGLTLPADAVLALVAAEVLIHGRDIARAVKAPWRIERGTAAEVLLGLGPVFEKLDVSAPRPLVAVVSLRHSGTFAVSIGPAGTSVTSVPPRRPDCTLSADPVAFLLCSYRRRSPYIAAARGAIAVRGPRPWAAVALSRLAPRD